MIVEKMKDVLLNLVYPPRCPLCDKVLARPGFCDKCRKKITFISGRLCMKCGKMVCDDREYCNDCEAIAHRFSTARSVYLYEGEMKNIMYRFKYSGRRDYAEVFADDAYRICCSWLSFVKPDIVMPVPMFSKKKRKRGYNQAEDIAYSLTRKLASTGSRKDILTDNKSLVRVKDTKALKTMNPSERRLTLSGAFQYRGSGVKSKKILLVDDIYTTGATIDACADALLNAGAMEVSALTVCTGEDLRK